MTCGHYPNRRILIAFLAALLALLPATNHRAKAQDDAEALKKEREELLKQYSRLTSERYYRQPSTLYDRVLRFSQMDPETISPIDQYLQAFYDGMADRPQTTFGTMNDDVLAHFDPAFQREDFVRIIQQNAWPE